jgi:hypothetical protein
MYFVTAASAWANSSADVDSRALNGARPVATALMLRSNQSRVNSNPCPDHWSSRALISAQADAD